MMRQRMEMVRLLAAGVLLVVAGCSNSPVTRFYTMNPVAVPAPADARGSMTVVIGAVSLPDGLDRPQIVLRGAGNQVMFSEFERWLGSPRD